MIIRLIRTRHVASVRIRKSSCSDFCSTMASNQLRRHLTRMMVLQRFTRRTANLCLRRKLSGSGSFVSIQDDPDIKELAIVTMQKKPVNAICPRFMKDLVSAMDALEEDNTKRAVIITSAFPGVFSAGIDLQSFLGNSPEELKDLWVSLVDSWLSLFRSRLVSVAAVNGHSIAGGCAYSIACDYRIMADDYQTGLTITKMGVPVPAWLRSQMANLIGVHEATKAVQLGNLFKSREALKKGLVDKVVPLKQVLDEAKQEVTRWLEISDDARVPTKRDVNDSLIRQIVEHRDSEVDKYVALFRQPHVQENIAKALEKLKARKGGQSS